MKKSGLYYLDWSSIKDLEIVMRTFIPHEDRAEQLKTYQSKTLSISTFCKNYLFETKNPNFYLDNNPNYHLADLLTRLSSLNVDVLAQLGIFDEDPNSYYAFVVDRKTKKPVDILWVPKELDPSLFVRIDHTDYLRHCFLEFYTNTIPGRLHYLAERPVYFVLPRVLFPGINWEQSHLDF